MYGVKQWERGNGFTAAQSVMNVVESLLYMGYLFVWWSHGRIEGGRRVVKGREGALAVVMGFSAAVMTVSKTALYCEFDLDAVRIPWQE
jgi:hypothetical protein